MPSTKLQAISYTRGRCFVYNHLSSDRAIAPREMWGWTCQACLTAWDAGLADERAVRHFVDAHHDVCEGRRPQPRPVFHVDVD